MTPNLDPLELTVLRLSEPQHPLQRSPKCCKGAIIGVHRQSGNIAVIPAACHRWDCPACAERKAAAFAHRLFAAEPERHLTLTWDTKRPETPEQAIDVMKKALPRFIQYLRHEKGRPPWAHYHSTYTIEYAAIWELTERGYPHIHMATWGGWLPQDYMSRLWLHLAGASIVHIKFMYEETNTPHHWTKYLLKAIPRHKSLFQDRRMISFSNGYNRNPDALPAEVGDNDYRWFFVLLPPQEVFDTLVLKYNAADVSTVPGHCEFEVSGRDPPLTAEGLTRWLDYREATQAIELERRQDLRDARRALRDAAKHECTLF